MQKNERTKKTIIIKFYIHKIVKEKHTEIKFKNEDAKKLVIIDFTSEKYFLNI